MKLIVFTDGASRGNPGHSSYGYSISDKLGKLIYEEGKYIGVTTNNVAEYTAVLQAFKYIKHKYGKKEVEIELCADSKLVVEQLSGRYKIKSAHLKSIIEQIKLIGSECYAVTYKHIPRIKNFTADRLANLALDSRI